MGEHIYGKGKVKMTRLTLEGVHGLAIENVGDSHEIGSVEPGWKAGDKKHLDGSETVLWFEGNAVGGINALMAELVMLRATLTKEAPTDD